MDMKTELQPEFFIRYSLKMLPRSEALLRIQNLIEGSEKKYDSIRSSEVTFDTDLSKKKREYRNIQISIDENEKYMQEECKVYELDRKNNSDILDKVEAFREENTIRELANQNQMIELRDKLSGISRYNEEELSAEMNDLKSHKIQIFNAIRFQNLVLKKPSITCNDKQHMRQKIGPLKYATQQYKNRKSKLLIMRRLSS